MGVRRFSTIDVVVPSLGGESISEGTLMEWRKQVGEAVAKDEVIAVIETDKVSIEVNAPESGVIAELIAQPDDTVKLDQQIAKITPGAGGAAAAAPAPAAAAPPATPKAAAPAAAAAPPAAPPVLGSRGERREKM